MASGACTLSRPLPTSCTSTAADTPEDRWAPPSAIAANPTAEVGTSLRSGCGVMLLLFRGGLAVVCGGRLPDRNGGLLASARSRTFTSRSSWPALSAYTLGT